MTGDDVRAAAARLADVGGLVRTPVVDVGGIACKDETQQVTRAFKVRGAVNLVAQLSAAERARGVVAASSGNHAQALAWAGRRLGAPVTVFMPTDAPAVKRGGALALGAEIVPYDRATADRDALVAAHAERTGAVVVPAYDDERIVAGAGTAALELLEDVPDLEVLVVPTSGGGSLAGWSLVVPHDVRLIGVCPEASDAPRRSFLTGMRERVAVGDTIADGLRLPTPGAVTFAVWSRRAGDVVTVSDAEVVRAREWLAAAGVAAEPSGAVALAAVLAGRTPPGRTGVLVSGGNADDQPAR